MSLKPPCSDFLLFFVSFLPLQGKREYLDTLHKYLEIHGTFFAMSVCLQREKNVNREKCLKQIN